MSHNPEIYLGQEVVMSPERSFHQAVENGIQKALDGIVADFEKNSAAENNLAYHNAGHTLNVVGRIELILERIQHATSNIHPTMVTERDVQLGRLIAAFHDRKQHWQENHLKDNQVMRQRATGENEEASAQAMIDYMNEVNANSRIGPIFGEDDKSAAREAIIATVPGFDPQRRTVIQPNVKPDSSVIAKALALADLGTAGMEGGKAFVEDGDKLFREDNLDIARALNNPAIDAATKESFRERMINWSNLQVAFVRGRQSLLDQELAGLPSAAQKSLKNDVFNRFEESAEAARAKADRRQAMSFEELAKDMGYQI